ncbi:hypothetical protein PAXINDRAFT_172008 [Paxillus involutus ATCC 200175]|uniref:Uncharacterized protein n=1 Tax=Paxillus involutus ATCC 200175 TaxID=664439 RepID=A0A0C9TUE0_PAXIN|nr:hypothetical protein PAXINDRAFT_172008 [Paxillus involutus ATCC 200175]
MLGSSRYAGGALNEHACSLFILNCSHDWNVERNRLLHGHNAAIPVVKDVQLTVPKGLRSYSLVQSASIKPLLKPVAQYCNSDNRRQSSVPVGRSDTMGISVACCGYAGSYAVAEKLPSCFSLPLQLQMRKSLLDDSLNGDQSTSAPLDTDWEHVRVSCCGLVSRRRARSALHLFRQRLLRGVTSSHRIPRHKIASTFLPLSSHYHTHVDARLLRYPEFSHFVAVDRSFATIDLTLCAFPSIRCNAVEGAPW